MRVSGFQIWCARRDLNSYVIDTRPSNVPVCQFQHTRIYQYFLLTGVSFIIIPSEIVFVNTFFKKSRKKYFVIFHAKN